MEEKRKRGRPVKEEPTSVLQVRIEDRYSEQIPKPHSKWIRELIIEKLTEK